MKYDARLGLWNFIGNLGFILGLAVFTIDTLPWGFPLPFIGRVRYFSILIWGWYILHGHISERIGLTKPHWYSSWKRIELEKGS